MMLRFFLDLLIRDDAYLICLRLQYKYRSLSCESISNGASSSSHTNGLEGVVVGLFPTWCVRNLPIPKKKLILTSY